MAGNLLYNSPWMNIKTTVDRTVKCIFMKNNLHIYKSQKHCKLQKWSFICNQKAQTSLCLWKHRLCMCWDNFPFFFKTASVVLQLLLGPAQQWCCQEWMMKWQEQTIQIIKMLSDMSKCGCMYVLNLLHLLRWITLVSTISLDEEESIRCYHFFIGNHHAHNSLY